MENLQAMQEVRRRMDPEAAEKIDEFCGKLEECADGMRRFTVILNDPAGNCFIETPTDLLDKDPYLKQEKYKRSTAQSKAIGLAVPEDYQDGTCMVPWSGPQLRQLRNFGHLFALISVWPASLCDSIKAVHII